MPDDDRETPVVCLGCQQRIRGDESRCPACGRVFSPQQLQTQHRKSSGSFDFGRSLQISMVQLAELVSTIGSVEADAVASRIYRLTEEMDGWADATSEKKQQWVELIKQLRERATRLLNEDDDKSRLE